MNRSHGKSIEKNAEDESFTKNPRMDKLGIGYMDRFFDERMIREFGDETVRDILVDSEGEIKIAQEEAFDHRGSLQTLTRRRLKFCLNEINGLSLSSCPEKIQMRIVETITQIERILRTKVCA